MSLQRSILMMEAPKRTLTIRSSSRTRARRPTMVMVRPPNIPLKRQPLQSMAMRTTTMASLIRPRLAWFPSSHSRSCSASAPSSTANGSNLSTRTAIPTWLPDLTGPGRVLRDQGTPTTATRATRPSTARQASTPAASNFEEPILEKD